MAPDGMVLKHEDRSEGDLKIWFEPISGGRKAVVVSVRVHNAHPVIAALRSVKPDSDGWIHTRHNADFAHVRIHKTHA